MGSDEVTGAMLLQYLVSIRAPAWGATTLFVQHLNLDRVSIRAPAWGATCACIR